MKTTMCPAERDARADEPEEPPGSAGTESAIREATSVASSSFVQRQRRERSPRVAAATRPEVRGFLRRWYPEATLSDWNDWRWQLRHRIRSLTELSETVELSEKEQAGGAAFLPVAITPYYATLLDRFDPTDPIRRSVIPTAGELATSAAESADPLGEDADMVVPGLVHRYPDRVLFLVTEQCAVYCRYCTRSRRVGRGDGVAEYTESFGSPSTDSWERALRYIAEHREIRDVLVSGGDPLTLSDHRLEYLLQRIREIPHVEIIRIGTKTPVVLPHRFTPKLLRTLRSYHPLWMSIHVSHPRELTPEMRAATAAIADAGIPMGSQTVLLKGINDSVATMRELNQGLLTCRVRPYYLYQCDPIPGSADFRTAVSKGIEIIEGLRGHTSGYAVPQYVIDAPGGGGKIPLLPNYNLGRTGESLLLRNYEDRQFIYPDREEQE